MVVDRSSSKLKARAGDQESQRQNGCDYVSLRPLPRALDSHNYRPARWAQVQSIMALVGLLVSATP